jgi:hypothetical protein
MYLCMCVIVSMMHVYMCNCVCIQVCVFMYACIHCVQAYGSTRVSNISLVCVFICSARDITLCKKAVKLIYIYIHIYI